MSGSIWLVRNTLTSKSAIDKAIRDLKYMGIGQAFVQVSGRLYSFFPSAILPTAEVLTGESEFEDPFGYFVEEANKVGIKVHAWINVFYAWSREEIPKSQEHPFNLHPEWFVHDRNGVSTHTKTLHELQVSDLPGYFISPVHSSFINLMRRYVEEIVTKYEVAGIHLDYTRYPSRDTGLGELERSLFEREYYVDPLLLFGDEEILRGRFGSAGVADLQKKWEISRAGIVSDAVRSIRSVLESSGQEITLSAAVIPDPDSARAVYGQDWELWLDENIVDFAVIMSYATHMEQFVKFLDNPSVKSHAAQIVAGVSTYNQSLDTAVEEARYALEAGLAGASFFSYNDLSSGNKSLEPIRRLFIEM